MIVALTPPPFTRLLTRAAAAAAVVCLAPMPAQQRGDRLLVCNRAEDTVSIFDPITGGAVATLATGPAPNEVAVSPDGCTAVVTNSRSGVGGRRGADLTVVDVVAARVRSQVQLAGPEAAPLQLHGVTFAPDGRVLASSAATGRTLALDRSARRELAAWRLGRGPTRLIALSPDGSWAAATHPREGAVTFCDLEGLEDRRAPAWQRSVEVGPGAEGIDIHPDTQHAWVASRGDDCLRVIAATTGEVVACFDTGRAPLRVAFTRRGDRALVTCVLGGELMIFDAAQPALLAEVSIHGDRSEQSSLPLDVVSDPDGRRAYVTCARGEFVAVIDLQRAALIDRIDARRGPDGLAYARPDR